jgi:hypothetical protein
MEVVSNDKDDKGVTSARVEFLTAKLKQELAGPDASIKTRKRDLQNRIDSLNGLLRGGPMTTNGGQKTAEFHIREAVHKLMLELRRLEELGR